MKAPEEGLSEPGVPEGGRAESTQLNRSTPIDDDELELFGPCLLCGGDDHDTHEHMYLEVMGQL